MWGLSKRQDILNEGIELQTTTRINGLRLLEFASNFEYLKSLLVKDTHDRIFRKNTSYIPGDNGSSLNITIPIKIIALTNISIIKRTVLLLYLLVHYLFFNSFQAIRVIGCILRVYLHALFCR